MITQWLRYGVLLLLAFGLSSGCSGSGNNSADDGGGIGGTGTVESTEVSFGRITSFGSIRVTNIHFNIDNAVLTADGETISEASLGLGDVVLVFGNINPDRRTGVATSVIANDEVEGPVTNVAQAADGVIAVLGQTVRANQTTDTIFAGFTALEDLALGSVVEVHGFVDPVSGDILATRIELKALTMNAGVTPIEIKGVVANFNGSDQFTLGSLTVLITDATEVDVAGGLADGIFVEVKGTLNATFDTLTAIDIEDTDGNPFVNIRPGVEVKLEGFITDFDSLADFHVRGVPVNAENAEIEGGSVTELTEGVPVEVEGVFDNAGVLIADEVEIEQQSIVRIEANVEGLPTATRLDVGFGTQRLAVHITTATKLRNKTGNGSKTLRLTDIREGERVKIRAFQNTATGKVIATRLERQGSNDANDDVKLRGPVDRAERATARVVIVGIAVDTSVPNFVCAGKDDDDGNTADDDDAGDDDDDAGDDDDNTISCVTLFGRLNANPDLIVEAVDKDPDGVFDALKVEDDD